MLIIYATLVLAIGILIGYYAGKTKGQKIQQTFEIDQETLAYLIERDNELWQLEKLERSGLRYICPKLTKLDFKSSVDQQHIYLN